MKAYRFLFPIVHAAMRLWHPVFRVSGREHLKEGQQMIICCNHSGMADPLWILFGLNLNKECPAVVAKASVMKVPLLGAFLRKFGVFGVNRGEVDVSAAKAGLDALAQGKNLMIFPEGTRVKKGKVIMPRNGAVKFSLRTGVPIVPVYLTAKRYPFSPLRFAIGAPWMPQCSNEKPSAEELTALTQELMEKIYALGETK